MTRRVRWTQRALDHLVAASQYIEDEREGAGLELIDLAEAAMQKAKKSPYRFPRAPEEEETVRRALISKYGRWVIYEIEGETLVVLAVWHGNQDPRGWRDS